jgi:hypothetical protein
MQIAFHWQAVLLAALVGVVVPGLWYSPFAFLKTWLRLSGTSEEAFKARPLWVALALSVAGSLLTALCLDGFFFFIGPADFGMGALAALQLYGGLVLPAQVVSHAYEGKPWSLFALNLGPGLINAVVMGGLLASMR